MMCFLRPAAAALLAVAPVVVGAASARDFAPNFEPLRPSTDLSSNDLNAAVIGEREIHSRDTDRTWLSCGGGATLFAARRSLGPGRVKTVANHRHTQADKQTTTTTTTTTTTITTACFLSFASEVALDELGITDTVPVPVAYKVQPDLIRYHGVEGAEDAEVMDLSHLVVEVCEMINEMINGNEN